MPRRYLPAWSRHGLVSEQADDTTGGFELRVADASPEPTATTINAADSAAVRLIERSAQECSR